MGGGGGGAVSQSLFGWPGNCIDLIAGIAVDLKLCKFCQALTRFVGSKF